MERPVVRILLTTTSYQDTPGPHHDRLAESGFEVVRERGPLSEPRMLELIAEQTSAGGGFDGLLNGDDAITARVIDAALNCPTPLKVIAKYGIGLDSIDVEHATAKRLPVLFTPGVNHTTVAEHAIGLMIAAAKHFALHLPAVQRGEWKRKTGTELYGKTLAVLGMGRVGKELVKRARAFGMHVVGYDLYWDNEFAELHTVQRQERREEALAIADVVSLHLPATEDTRELINADTIAMMKDSSIIINTARGTLVNEADVAEACRTGKLAAYATDVLAEEPMKTPHPFQNLDNVVVTPHVGSRTLESVQRQAMRATDNLVNFLTGEEDYIQANTW